MLEMQATTLNCHRQMEHFNHHWLEDFRASGGIIHCTRGCANCCNMAVHATFPEAVMVTGSLTQSQLAELGSYVDKLVAMTGGLQSMSAYLKKHRDQLHGCPFLAEKECTVYDMRPVACRSLLSTKPGDWCAVDLASLDIWDRQLYEQSLDMQTVAWPTHYVAASQDFGLNLEQGLLAKMLNQCGWNLRGNFPLLIWLEKTHQLSKRSAREAAEIIERLPFQTRYLLVMQTAAE